MRLVLGIRLAVTAVARCTPRHRPSSQVRGVDHIALLLLLKRGLINALVRKLRDIGQVWLLLLVVTPRPRALRRLPHYLPLLLNRLLLQVIVMVLVIVICLADVPVEILVHVYSILVADSTSSV